MRVRNRCLAYFFVLWAATAATQENSAPVVEGVDLDGLATVTRRVDKMYPVQPAPAVSIANKYGAIRVTSWDNPVVGVIANIRVGAAKLALAEAFAQGIEISAAVEGNYLEIRTVYPEPDTDESIGYSVDLEVQVPRDAVLSVSNSFGDTYLKGLGGPATIDARYGLVDLRDMDSEVRVRARGEFALRADRLRAGGTFILRSTQASFTNISGVLNVDNYLGNVEIRSLGDVVTIDVTCESGAIDLHLPINLRPAIEATVEFGEIASALPLALERHGDTQYARLANEDSPQRIALHAIFGAIAIHQEGLQATEEPLRRDQGESLRAIITRAIPATEFTEVLVDATVAGDVVIVATDGRQVQIEAEQYVRVLSRDNAQLALEGLALRTDSQGTRLRIRTVVQEDMEALGCTSYRLNLRISCPPGLALRVVVQDGATVIQSVASDVIVDQARGTIEVRDTAGALDITNRSGDIAIVNSSGPVVVSCAEGVVTARNTRAELSVTCTNGKTIIDSPASDVTVRNTGGDVRVIALEGIHGDFDIIAEEGNLSMAIDDTASALFILSAYGGAVHSSIPVTGTTEGDVQIFQGRLNDATYRVLLETHGGNIVLD